MFAKPQAEHLWLQQLVGQWTFEHQCEMPDGSRSTSPGKMTCRSLGDLWLIAESSGQSEPGSDWSAIMTLGFDPAKGHFVGTFVGSMMTNLWQYAGTLDAGGKILPLETEGPKMDGSGLGKFRDTIEIIDQDTWMMYSDLLTDDGSWFRFMQSKHVRCKT